MLAAADEGEDGWLLRTSVPLREALVSTKRAPIANRKVPISEMKKAASRGGLFLVRHEAAHVRNQFHVALDHPCVQRA
jgi:hypothetical protein